MPVFELEDPTTGKVYEVEAPDVRRAVGAFKQFQPDSAPVPQAKPPQQPSNPLERPGAAERVLRYTPIGSWLDEAGAAGDAAINWATGGRAGRPYEEGVVARRQAQAASDAENPIRNTVEGAVGAVVTAPMAPVARVFQGQSLLPQMGNSALSGLGWGALFGAGEGEPGDRTDEAATGGAIGALVGAAAPPVARGLGNAANAVANWAKPLPQDVAQFSKPAINRVSRAVGDDDLLNSYARQAQELGPEGMLADMGPNLRGQASAIATQPGAGQRMIVDAMENRADGARQRITQDLDATLGPARNRVQMEENVVGQARTQASPHYDVFYRTPVPMTPELQSVVPRLRAAGVLAKAQRLAAIEGRDPRVLEEVVDDVMTPMTGLRRTQRQRVPTGQEWDYMKRAADDLAAAADPGSNEQRLFRSLARDIRYSVDEALSPGQPDASPWALARQMSGDGRQFREGLEEGATAFARGTHPDQLAADLARMPYVQRQGFNEGARGQIRDIMGNAATAQGENGATAARRALGSEYARDKIAMVASQPGGPTTQTPVRTTVQGRQAADRLVGRLDAETTFANTRQQTYQGTQTAARKAAQQEFPSGATTSAATEVGKKSASGLAMEGVYRLGNFLMGGMLNERRARVATDAAQMLIAQGASREAIVRGLRQYMQNQSASSAAARNVERFINQLMASARPPAVSGATTETNPDYYLDRLSQGAR
jgi:hypothetical protein